MIFLKDFSPPKSTCNHYKSKIIESPSQPARIAVLSITWFLNDSPQIRATPYSAHEETTLTLHNFLGAQTSQRRVVNTWRRDSNNNSRDLGVQIIV